MEDITWLRGDTKFLLGVLKSISLICTPSDHVILVLTKTLNKVFIAGDQRSLQS